MIGKKSERTGRSMGEIRDETGANKMLCVYKSAVVDNSRNDSCEEQKKMHSNHKSTKYETCRTSHIA